MAEGTKVRLKIKTTLATYTGDFFIPSTRKRFSDVINAPGSDFINLTDVEVDGTAPQIEHLSLSKYLIESIRSLEADRKV